MADVKTGMTFKEAEARFLWLKGQRATGNLDEAAYQQELARLRVTDAQGRLWRLEERTGQWQVWNGRQWAAASPEVAPTAPLPVAVTAPLSTDDLRAVGAPTIPLPRPGRSAFEMTGVHVALYLLTWAATWLVVAVLVTWFVAEPRGRAVMGLGAGLVALLSLVLLMAGLAGLGRSRRR